MTRVRYHLLDVFTDSAFTGNPLAVFVDPPELTDAQMQTLAREINLSETVFVHSPGSGETAWPTRIFTPTTELPFAGHPTVGTAVLLAELDLSDDRLVLAEGVGDVAVTVEPRDTERGDADRASRATFRTPGPPQVTATDEWTGIAHVLGIDTADLHHKLAPSIWSCGVAFWIVPVRDVDVLARVAIDMSVWSERFQYSASEEFYVLAPVDDSFDTWQARMFAPAFGLIEDPATGAAAAASAGFLAGSRQLVDGPMRWVIRQGVEMGRPSEITVELDRRGSEVVAVFVSGDAVVVGEGEIALPSE